MLNGIDVASYQKNLNIVNINCDFVIVKATEGVNYVNPSFSQHCQQTLSSDKLLGLYHFADGYNPILEAKHFLNVSAPYIDKAVLVLDFEGSVVHTGGVSWAKEFLDYVREHAHTTPIIYMGLSDENCLNWYSCCSYPLWIAQYNNFIPVSGFAPRAIYGSVRHFKTIKIFQYTSCGRLNGYQSNLDFNVFYGDKEDWQKLISSDSEEDIELSYHPLVDFNELGRFLVTRKNGANLYSTSSLDKPLIENGSPAKRAYNTAYKIFKAENGAVNAGGWFSQADGITKINPLAINENATGICQIVKPDAYTQNIPEPNQAGITHLELGTAWKVCGRVGKYLKVGNEKTGIFISADKAKIVL